MLPTALRAAAAPLRPARALSARRWAPRAMTPPPESAALREKARIIFGNLPSTNERSGNKVLCGGGVLPTSAETSIDRLLP